MKTTCPSILKIHILFCLFILPILTIGALNFRIRNRNTSIKLPWRIFNWTREIVFGLKGSRYNCSAGIWRGKCARNNYLNLVMVLMCPNYSWISSESPYKVVGLSQLLKTNLEKGIKGDPAELVKRRNAFGSNNYPRKKGRSFLVNFGAHWSFDGPLFIGGYCTDIIFLLPFIDVYLGCLQGPDLDYFNGSCHSFISIRDKIWGEVHWESYDVILCFFTEGGKYF